MKTSIITYDIMSDQADKLKTAAKVACNFWNRFIMPGQSVVVKLGVFTSAGFVIARAYHPYSDGNTIYGVVEFNTEYLDLFNQYEIASTVIHEIGHTLGIGWATWYGLFDHDTGAFFPEQIEILSDLQYMFVETDFGPGTQYLHWDEGRFDRELMTGIKNDSEYVLPVTIRVMALLSHTIVEELEAKTDLKLLLCHAESVLFSRAGDVEVLDKSHFVETEIAEEIYYRQRERGR